MPGYAIWACTEGAVLQGKLDVHILRELTGRIDEKKAIFVEDNFAKLWVEVVLRNFYLNEIDTFGVYAVGGDGSAVKMHQMHEKNPAVPTRSICIIDGDSLQIETQSVIRLPGFMPESYIYDAINERIKETQADLCERLGLDSVRYQYEVAKRVRETRLLTRDSHIIFSKLGKSFGKLSDELVKSAFLGCWVRFYEEEAKAFAEKIYGLFEEPNT